MNILITGGAGFIGSHLTERMVELGHTVWVVDDLSSGSKKNLERVADKISFIQKDVRDLNDSDLPPCAVVFHLAAWARVQRSFLDPLGYHRNNVGGMAAVLDQARRWGTMRVVFASSSSVYGDQTPPFREDMDLKPGSPYAFDKAICENLCREYAECCGIPSIVALRLFNVYGSRMSSGQYSTVIQSFMDAVREGRPLCINGDGTHTRDFTYVLDVVNAFEKAVEADLPRGLVHINIGAGKAYSVNEIARCLSDKVEHGPEVVEPRATLADNANARELLGWEPRADLEKALLMMADLGPLV